MFSVPQKDVIMFVDNDYFDSAEKYRDFYSLDFADDLHHEFVTFTSSDVNLVGQIYRPDDYTATVFILHGYLSHSAMLRFTIQRLTDEGYAVATLDLHGHGLSGGEVADINDFSQYSDALAQYVTIIQDKLHGSYHLVAHSLGCAVVEDYLLIRRQDPFDKVILGAPLVRSWLWDLSKISYDIGAKNLEWIPRAFGKCTSDKQYRTFIRTKDPFQARKVPIQWVQALFAWNKRIEQAQPLDRKIYILQPKKDTVVSYQYNIPFLRTKFSDVDVTMLPKCRHELFNESKPRRDNVFDKMTKILES